MSCGRGCLVAPQADAPLSLAGLERALVPARRWPFGDAPPVRSCGRRERTEGAPQSRQSDCGHEPGRRCSLGRAQRLGFAFSRGWEGGTDGRHGAGTVTAQVV